ncbi:MAG: UPF0280 family protein, partial [Candidatus Altiarchaeota archaeon]
EELVRAYSLVEDYISKNSFFGLTYEPCFVGADAPEIVRVMASAAVAAGTGPMAAVAGSIAEHLGKFILAGGASWVVVENGGDIYLRLSSEKTVGVYAGESPFSGKLAFNVKPGETPLGVCTSAASVGHSVSLGDADAVVAVAKSTPLADAAATAIGNEVKGGDAVKKGLLKAGNIPGLSGVLIIKGGELATWGSLPALLGADFRI